MPKGAAETGKKRIGRAKKHAETYGAYVRRVLKLVHPNMRIGETGLSVMNSFVQDMFERIVAEAGRQTRFNKRQTLTARDVQTAVRLVLPDELGRHAVSEGTRAMGEFSASLKKQQKQKLQQQKK